MDCKEKVLLIIQVVTALGTFVALCELLHQWLRDESKDMIEQASKVCCWIEHLHDVNRVNNCGYDESIIISNESKQPIYDARISIQMIFEEKIDSSHDNEYAYIQCIPSGSFRLFKSNEYHGMSKIFNAAISFRDVRGNYWERDAAGKLRQLEYEEFSRFINRPEVQADFERITL